MTHKRIRKFNTKDTYPEQNLDNDLCQAVVTEGGKTIWLRGQCPQNLDDAVNLHMLRLIKENAGKIAEDSSHSKSKAAISEINEHLKLKEALNEAIKYLDQQ